MTIERDLLDEVKNLDSPSLQRLNFFTRGLMSTRAEEQPEILADTVGKVSFRKKMIPCGRPNCARCPHGPYWYVYWREGGRRRSRYLGRQLDSMAGELPLFVERQG